MLRRALPIVLWLPVVGFLVLVAVQGGLWTLAAAALAAPFVIFGTTASREIRRLEREGPENASTVRATQARMDAEATRLDKHTAIGSGVLIAVGTVALIVAVILKETGDF